MDRVIVIGRPGSGKSTFARKLSEITKLNLIYLDMLFWNSDKTHVERDVFDTRLDEELKKEKWIIDGNYIRTLKRRLEKCDTVFFFDVPIKESIDGINNRVGKKREDMPWIEDKFDDEFKDYVISFDKEQKDEILQMLNDHINDKQIYIFHNQKESNEYIEKYELVNND